MGSSGKKRTTMAKLNREGRLREKRVEKEARRVARRLTAARDAAEAEARLGDLDTASDESDGAGPGADEAELAAAVRDLNPGKASAHE